MRHHITYLFLFFLLGCGSSKNENTFQKKEQSLVKTSVSIIENHEQFIELPYSESYSANSCEISNIAGVNVTTSCSCSSGVCTVGITPIGTGLADFEYSVTDGTNTETRSLDITVKAIVPFVSTWWLPGGFGADETVTLPLRSGFNYDFTVDWGDGTTTEVTSWDDVDKTHTYASTGTYTITITGLLETLYFNNTSSDKDDIISISELGTVGWKSFENAFYGCTNLGSVAGGDTSEVTDMKWMFYTASNVSPDTSGWDTSNVKDMSNMFNSASVATPDTTNWNTSQVTLMEGMFRGANTADPVTTNWDTSQVTSMRNMFWDASTANPVTTNWDTSQVTDMSNMFRNATNANPDTENWDTSNVTDMRVMFYNADSANPNTENWDTSKVTSMRNMFAETSLADPDMSGWDFSSLTDIELIFSNASLSTSNYDSMLIQLDATAPAGLILDVGTTKFTSSSLAEAARNNLTVSGWTINDGGGI